MPLCENRAWPCIASKTNFIIESITGNNVLVAMHAYWGKVNTQCSLKSVILCPRHCPCDMLQKWRLWQSLQNREPDLQYLNKFTNLMASLRIVPIVLIFITWTKIFEIEDMHNLCNLKTDQPSIGLTHKTTQQTHRQFWVCYYGLFSEVWCITNVVQRNQLDLIGSVISRSAKLVCGNHRGDSFHIFNISTLPDVVTPDALTSLLSLCFRVICAWGRLAVHHWALLERFCIDF